MKQISSMDLFYLNTEFKEILEESRIETFYQEGDNFYIKVYVKGMGHFFLKNNISKYIFLTDKKDEDSTIPKSFIQYLRKFLKNGFIQKIEQIENERILKLEISKKTRENEKNKAEIKNNKTEDNFEIYYLIIELFANGNIIITDNQLKILNSLQKKKFKDRTVMVKDIYALPPQKEISIFKLNNQKELFVKKLKEFDSSIVKFLAIKLGLGGKFAEEIVYNSKINKNKLSSEINLKEIETIIKESERIINLNINPSLIFNEKNEFIDFEPIKLNSIKKERKKTKTFNEAIRIYYSQFNQNNDKKKDEFQKELKKLKNRIKKQEKLKEEILIKYEKYNNLGNKIYENYSIIEDLLNQINKTAKEKGWDYVKIKIKENEKLSKIIKKIDTKNNEIILDL